MAEPKTIELTVSPMRIISGVITVAAFVSIVFAAAGWVFKADATHVETHSNLENIGKLSEIVDGINDQQQLERKLWGDSYEKRISKILEDDPTQGETKK